MLHGLTKPREEQAHNTHTHTSTEEMEQQGMKMMMLKRNRKRNRKRKETLVMTCSKPGRYDHAPILSEIDGSTDSLSTRDELPLKN